MPEGACWQEGHKWRGSVCTFCGERLRCLYCGRFVREMGLDLHYTDCAPLLAALDRVDIYETKAAS